MKKFKKLSALFLAAVMFAGVGSACSGKKDEPVAPANTQAPAATQAPASTPAATPEAQTSEVTAIETEEPKVGILDYLGLEMRNGKPYFKETQEITVEIFDRGTDGGKTAPENNYYTDWIKAGVLADHNIKVTYDPIPRWTEDEEIGKRLGANSAPDVAYTYQYAKIKASADAGGVWDLYNYLLDENGQPLLTNPEAKNLFPNMWALLQDFCIFYNQEEETEALYALVARLANQTRTAVTVREDWLAKLGMSVPTTLEEFEAMLYAFKEHAAELVDDPATIVPFSIAKDSAYRIRELAQSFIPSNITEKDMYINGWDERGIGLPGFKDALRYVNKWYNDGLIWDEFYLRSGSGQTQGNSIYYPNNTSSKKLQSNAARNISFL